MTGPEGGSKVRASQYLGYAAGDVANNLTFSMVSAFLLIYYTDVAGIPAATAGTLFLGVRVWGGVADLIAGRRVDQTSTRWGRFRPYVLFGSFPVLVLFVAMFSIPASLSTSGQVVWAAATYALFQLAYSFVNIPYGSLAATMTQRPDERARFSSARVVASSLTILVIAVVVSPQISAAEGLQRSLTITTIVFAVIGFALYLWCFATAREVVEQPEETVGLRPTLAMMRQNRPLIVLCLASVLFLAGLFSLQTVGVYYARDVLGDADLYIVLTVVQTVGMIGAAGIVPAAVGALGKKRTYIAAGVFGAAAAVVVAVAPASTPAVGITAFGMLGFAMGVINTLIFALQPDTVEYGEWRSGIRAEGGSYSVLSFTRKVGQGIGGAAGAYTLGLGGYISGAASQTDGAVTAIRVAAGVVPAVAILAAAAVMLAYPLTEDALRKLVAETSKRRALGRAAGAGGP